MYRYIYVAICKDAMKYRYISIYLSVHKIDYANNNNFWRMRFNGVLVPNLYVP